MGTCFFSSKLAQVVEADGTKPVALEQYGKDYADVAQLQAVFRFIHQNSTQEICVIEAATKYAVLFLLLL